ncbi:hypothetical protein BOTBODRAFT_39883 [Botryobasidium botryosum FD-172 SS1]|uniref:Uncharacterized protein n=1 Tax=Botryobasidium botryosum (strain FD-172 SS1) TaxID=930990 RepID=A0A067LSC7_BOTB1|nr:hypothetical protein BOTBODRAFT_39883 [Botryobasidium botryosum FD-172 SS1]
MDITTTTTPISIQQLLPPTLKRDSIFLALGEVLPTLKALIACACAIFILCLAALGLQSNDTIIVVDNVARGALLLASLSSGFAIVSGSAGHVHTILMDPGDLELLGPLPASFRPSQLIYAASCTWISLSGISLSVFMVRVAHTTSPTISMIFFAVTGFLSAALLLFALMYRWMGRQSPTQPGAVV